MKLVIDEVTNNNTNTELINNSFLIRNLSNLHSIALWIVNFPEIIHDAFVKSNVRRKKEDLKNDFL